MPNLIYSKVKPDLLLLAVNRNDEIKEKRTDLCPENEYLQISTKIIEKDTEFKPHKHNKLDRQTDITQEAWIILTGAIEASFWDIDDTIIHKTVLKSGDCAVVFHAGHSFKVLEDKTTLYEVKNGPYYGVEKDKTFIGE